MKFELSKSGKLVSLLMHYDDSPKILHQVVINKRIFITAKAPKDQAELLVSINSHLKHGSISSANEFHDQYHRSMKEKIEHETGEIIKSYLRIQEAMKCINLSDSIRLSQN